MSEIPNSLFSRGKVVGVTATKVGLKELGHRTKSVFSKVDQSVHDEEIAQIVFKSLSLLRGAALKAAQLLCMEAEILPEAMQKELAKSCYQVPPINRALIRKCLMNAFHQSPEALFQSFSSTPFAAASLGQVHEAIAKDGRKLAVKVQYPGIAETLDSDINLLHNLIRFSNRYELLKDVVEEIHERLSEELNYEIEAQNTDWFRNRLHSNLVTIAKIVSEYSTNRVLTTEKLDGLHLAEWLDQDPPKEERDRFAQLLADVWDLCVHEIGAIHADPNPGNYLYLNDGTLGILDFGCVKQVDPEVSQAYREVLYASIEGDSEKILAVLQRLGIQFVEKKGSVEAQKRIAEEWINWYARPLKVPRFDFSANTNYMAEGYSILMKLARIFQKGNRNFVFIDRTWMGLMRIFVTMGAEVDLRPSRKLLISLSEPKG